MGTTFECQYHRFRSGQRAALYFARRVRGCATGSINACAAKLFQPLGGLLDQVAHREIVDRLTLRAPSKARRQKPR